MLSKLLIAVFEASPIIHALFFLLFAVLLIMQWTLFRKIAKESQDELRLPTRSYSVISAALIGLSLLLAILMFMISRTFKV